MLEIEGLNIGINGECIDKVCGYANDIVFIIKECSRSIKKLSKLAIIQLNLQCALLVIWSDLPRVMITKFS